MKEKKDCDSQKQNCLEHTIVPVYYLQTYKEKEGYKYWYEMTTQERLSITDINSRLSRQPDFYAPNCRFSIFTGIWDFNHYENLIIP